MSLDSNAVQLSHLSGKLLLLLAQLREFVSHLVIEVIIHDDDNGDHRNHDHGHIDANGEDNDDEEEDLGVFGHGKLPLLQRVLQLF